MKETHNKEGKMKFITTTFVVDSQPKIKLNLIPSVAASSLYKTEVYQGLKNCHFCEGRGILISGKPCLSCVKKTGNCNVCKNTGLRPNYPGKKCQCIWGKDR